MALWTVEYWKNSETGNSPFEKWLSKLTKEQQCLIIDQIYRLKRAGNLLMLPHSKSLGKGLFELREMKYGYRMYYGFNGKCIIIIFAAGDKTSQDRDIIVARQRLLQVKKG